MTRSATDADARNADDWRCSARVPRSDAQRKISQYLRASAGTANCPSDHTLCCFIGMIQTGEATIEDMRAMGGGWLIVQLKVMAKENGWRLASE